MLLAPKFDCTTEALCFCNLRQPDKSNPMDCAKPILQSEMKLSRRAMTTPLTEPCRHQLLARLRLSANAWSTKTTHHADSAKHQP